MPYIHYVSDVISQWILQQNIECLHSSFQQFSSTTVYQIQSTHNRNMANNHWINYPKEPDQAGGGSWYIITHQDDHPFASQNFTHNVKTNNLSNTECSFHPNALHPMKCVLINPRSICNKLPIFHHLLNDQKLYICALTQTWIREDDIITPNKQAPYGHNCLSTPRLNKIGGGIALIHSSG